MKIVKISLVLYVVILVFSSCKESQVKYMHNKELRIKLEEYSDVFDLARTEIVFSGGRYNFFSSARSSINISLYLRHSQNIRESLIVVRDEFIAFFNNYQETKGKDRFANWIIINILLEEEGESRNYYWFSYDEEWYEHWCDFEILARLLAGKTIQNDKLNNTD